MSMKALNQGPHDSLESKLGELATIKTIEQTAIVNLFCKACIEADRPVPLDLARTVIDRPDLAVFYKAQIAHGLFAASADYAPAGQLPEQNSHAESLLSVALYARRIANEIESENSRRHWEEFNSGVNMG